MTTQKTIAINLDDPATLNAAQVVLASMAVDAIRALNELRDAGDPVGSDDNLRSAYHALQVVARQLCGNELADMLQRTSIARAVLMIQARAALRAKRCEVQA